MTADPINITALEREQVGTTAAGLDGLRVSVKGRPRSAEP
jgi:hypothetical protein